jgi:hypothetical protein
MPQMTTAEVCFHAGKSARFSASTPPTAWFDCLLCMRARSTVAQAVQTGRSGVHNHPEPGECRFNWPVSTACCARTCDLPRVWPILPRKHTKNQRDVAEMLVAKIFEHARRTPKKTALVYNQQAVSYALFSQCIEALFS